MAESTVFAYSWLILLLPAAAFVINGIWLGLKNWRAAAWLSTVLLVLNFVVALAITSDYYHIVLDNPGAYPDRTLIAWDMEWLPFATDVVVRMGVYLDPISVMMLLVVTIVCALVNFYSIGYMRDDPGAGRFFSLFSLFCFSMLGLVVATNIVQLFVFWELVGVSSYLLIGFWYHKPSAVAASNKAFIVTRCADAFFLVGIVIVGYHMDSFDFLVLNSPSTAHELNYTVGLGFFSVNLLTLTTILIFMGGWGKSAMFPLHVWLPDAMEGPTPVSATIHSATMVVAGVFLTARMFPLFAASETTLHLIGIVGAFTALFAAVIACTQVDIKRILAFSTLSQLGYMLFALGITKIVPVEGYHGSELNILGYQASMFHVFTHAFFKAMLFLIAGSVIHAVHSNDIWDMGRLKDSMPFTYISALIGCLALAGIFPFSGFWSKDEIIIAALGSGHSIIAAVGLIVGGLTAFYMFRLFFVVFHGKKPPAHNPHKAHENRYMTIPIVIMAVPSAIAGWLFKDHFILYVMPNLIVPEFHFAHPHWVPFIATGLGLAGILLAWVLYGRGELMLAETLVSVMGNVHTVIKNKLYIDEIYLFVTHRVIFALVAAPIKWFDRHIVDGAVNLVAYLLHFHGFLVRLSQSGQVQLYVAVIFLGIFLIYYLGQVPL